MSDVSVAALRLAVPHLAGTETLYARGEFSYLGESLVVPAGGQASLDTWFNSAPVAWWNQLYPRAKATLKVSGRGQIVVQGVTHSGATDVLATEFIDGDWKYVLDDLSTHRFVWLELAGRASEAAELKTYEWTLQLAEASPRNGTQPERVTVVVPTFKREDDALDQVEYLLGEQGKSLVARVVLIDQGNSIRSHPRTAGISAAHADRFVLLEQGNFGGSGGYARGMRESLRWPQDGVLLLDDDAHIDLESLRRAFELSRHMGNRTIVGTGLISAETKVHLEALAEHVDQQTFQWGASDGLSEALDLAETGPSNWTMLSATAKNDYCGWWGCLLPQGAVSELGLPAPFFIKWDDAEYGLRAGKAGYNVVTIPGVSVWHPTWASKQTSASWSSWMMHRNRLAVAATYGASRGVIKDSLTHQIKHLLSMQYDTANLWSLAIDEFAGGPQWLSVDMVNARNRSQAKIDAFTERLPVTDGSFSERPISRNDYLRALRGLVTTSAISGSERVVTPEQYSWRTSIGVQKVRVIDPLTGKNTRTLYHSAALSRELLRQALRQHWRLVTQWTRLSKIYSVHGLQGANVWKKLLP